MSSRYYWEGEDIADITGTTSTNSTINGYFSGFPGNTADATEISTQDGMTTNESDFNSLPIPNTSYFCYNDDEDADAPDYTVNGTSIFTKTISNQRLLVKYTSLSSTAGNGTLSIPSWCNGVKISFRCTNGTIGSTAGSSVSESNYNSNNHNNYNIAENNDHNVNRGFYHNRNNNHHNWNHNQHNDQEAVWNAQSGGSKGTGGIGKIGWFLKGIQFTAGSNNTIDYSISQTANANSIITVNENGSDIAVVTIKNGENGGSGTDAQSKTTDDTHHNGDHNHYDVDGDHNTHHHNWNHYNHEQGSTAGVDGSDGSAGTVTFSGSTPIYLYYNNSNTTENTRATIYYFRYKTS